MKNTIMAMLRQTPLIRPVFEFNELRLSLKDKKATVIGADGVPLPSRLQMVKVFNHANADLFISSGEVIFNILTNLAQKHRADWKGKNNILDWGCGCGRITRHFNTKSDCDIFGIDIEEKQVKWCKKNLKGDFRHVNINPPTNIHSEYFDGAFGLSVFTHLTENKQILWINEISRILKQGAIFIATYHDEAHVNLELAGFSKSDVAKNNVLVTTAQKEGSNLTASFQSEKNIINLAKNCGFQVLENIKSDASGIGQAIVVFKKL